MGRNWSDNILIVELPPEPQTSDELSSVIMLVLDRPKSDLLVDVGAVDEPNYQTLCKMMELYTVLKDHDRNCMFYNVREATKRIFNLYGFDKTFKIASVSEVVLKPSVDKNTMGTLEVHSSDKTKPLQRRNYVRLQIPAALEIEVLLWHSGRKDDYHKWLPGHHWHGRLVDISEGGAQVAIDGTEETPLGKGRLVGLEFIPMPGREALTFDAQIREMLPTADGRNICLGLKFVGLEANPEGRQGLRDICSSRGIYYEATENTTL